MHQFIEEEVNKIKELMEKHEIKLKDGLTFDQLLDELWKIKIGIKIN